MDAKRSLENPIQIQHLLKLNYSCCPVLAIGTLIQIQHLLKLNMFVMYVLDKDITFKYNTC